MTRDAAIALACAVADAGFEVQVNIEPGDGHCTVAPLRNPLYAADLRALLAIGDKHDAYLAFSGGEPFYSG